MRDYLSYLFILSCFARVFIANKAQSLPFKTYFCIGVFVETTFEDNDSSIQDMKPSNLVPRSHSVTGNVTVTE